MGDGLTRRIEDEEVQITLEGISTETLYEDFSKLSSSLLVVMFGGNNSSRVSNVILKILRERGH